MQYKQDLGLLDKNEQLQAFQELDERSLINLQIDDSRPFVLPTNAGALSLGAFWLQGNKKEKHLH